MSPASTAILIPVLDRPHRIAPLLANIAQATPEPHIVVFAASDEPTIAELDPLGAQYIRDAGDTWPNRINRLFHATTEPYVFLAGDDVLFHRGWLSHAMREMRDLDGVVVVNDLHNPAGTSALVSRGYIERESGCFDTPSVVVFPGYTHNFCDSELFETAGARDRFARCPASVVEHLHPCAGKAEMDSTYRKGCARYLEDKALFETRRRLWTRPSS
jgi:hypothetical protein